MFILDDIVGLTRNVFGMKLTGIYLHGSAAFGCFNPHKSDIDFIAIINSPVSAKEKVEYITALTALENHSECPAKGIEMSVVYEECCREFVYPTPFELHYSAAHRERFLENPEEFCRSMHGTDKDLAAHFTVIKAVGQTLYGKPVNEVFGEVKREYFLDSIMYDVGNSVSDIADEPIYFILNLCRAAEWAAENLPKKYAPLVNAAAESYRNDSAFPLDISAEVLREFAEYMLYEIN